MPQSDLRSRSPLGRSWSDGVNPLDCHAVDGRLEELLGVANTAPPFGTLASAVQRFIDDHSSPMPGPNAIFLPEWKEDWESGVFPRGQSPFQNTYILCVENLDAQQKNALTAVCDSMLRLLLDSKTPLQKDKHAAGLVEALREYLDLRGYDVSTEDVEAKTPRKPKPEAFQAFWLEQAGHSQLRIAEMLLGSEAKQGTISKWIAGVKKWQAAGNKIPEIPQNEPLQSKPVAVDPDKLDLGPRADHRPEGQRVKLAGMVGHDTE